MSLDIRAMLNVPVRERGRTVGLFYVHSPEPREWAPEDVAFARNVADRVQVGIARLRAEEQQVTLNHELSHRLKNTLAMVQAIATQTLRNAPDLETAQEALIARLIALGKAHDILLTGKGESADVHEIIQGALELHDDLQPGRFTLVGPALRTGEKAALSLALMIHELATNAAKYGALSTPNGRVHVSWGIAEQPGEQTVRLTWQEQGGPPVTPPSRKGFGSWLIERGLAGAVGGEVRTIYAPEGLVCSLVAPLSGFQLRR
ncbi:sensor histidine kinase [Methylobacterium nigriterrae]|uniref:sensor histidine kinase n=1 Tax=Methylobacterium nigriterrae TaxID=3127512 RepID=UPI0030134802